MGTGNIDARFGLRPVRHLNGNPWNEQVQECFISANYAVDLFVGDTVTLTAETDDQDTTATRPTIITGAAGDATPIYGVITSFDPQRATTLETIYSPASTEGIAQVCIDPDVIFEIRDDGAAAPTKLYPGQNANIIKTHTGNTTTGLSGIELDTNSTAPAADESYQLYILQMSNREDLTLAARSIWEVLINMHTLRQNSVGGTYTTGMLGITAT